MAISNWCAFVLWEHSPEDIAAKRETFEEMEKTSLMGKLAANITGVRYLPFKM
jgi:hypothetical protein